MRRGGKINEVCELVEKHGPLTSQQIRKALPHLAGNDLATYRTRAVIYGRLVSKNGLYFAAPGWREMPAAPLPPSGSHPVDPMRCTAKIYPNAPMPIASVWQLGDRA